MKRFIEVFNFIVLFIIMPLFYYFLVVELIKINLAIAIVFTIAYTICFILFVLKWGEFIK